MPADDWAGLAGYLTTPTFGRAHEHHRELGSTNDRAAMWARTGAPHGALVTADAQREGRGRRGRVWSSPPAVNIYASLVLRPPPVPGGLGPLALAVALGLHQGLPDRDVTIKWPNDLIAGGRKLAGILCECRWLGAQAEVVVGFGINVRRQAFPDALRDVATTLEDLGAPVPSRVELLARALASLESVLDRFFAGGFPTLHTEYVRCCPWIGASIVWSDGQGIKRPGRAIRLDPDGALVIACEGVERRLEAGEIGL